MQGASLGAGCKVQGSGCRVEVAGCWVLGERFRVQGAGLGGTCENDMLYFS